jgi:hypothetical protein
MLTKKTDEAAGSNRFVSVFTILKKRKNRVSPEILSWFFQLFSADIDGLPVFIIFKGGNHCAAYE